MHISIDKCRMPGAGSQAHALHAVIKSPFPTSGLLMTGEAHETVTYDASLPAETLRIATIRPRLCHLAMATSYSSTSIRGAVSQSA